MVGMLLSALAAVAIGVPTLRLRGHYFAIATLLIGSSVQIVFQRWDWVGCPADLAEIPKRIDQSAIRHFPQLWESLVRLQIRADDVFNDLVGAVNDSW